MNIGGHTVHTIGNVRAILSHMNVDADGGPHAYAPAGSGLEGNDYLANAGSPGNWWGIATNSQGTPYIQTDSDPAPGYYVSTTALEDSSKATRDPARYVNAETIPFVVIPSTPHFGIVLGDVGFGFNLATGDSTAFVVGDIGPSYQIGEASIAFAKNLNIDSNAKSGGTDSNIIGYVFFAGSKISWPADYNGILIPAVGILHSLGGLTYLKSNLTGWDWSKF